MTSPLSLDIVRESLAKELDIESLSKEEQETVISELSGVILSRLTMLVLQGLPEEKRDAFHTASESGDAAKVQAFITEHVPNVNTLIQQAVETEVSAFKAFQQTLPKEA